MDHPKMTVFLTQFKAMFDQIDQELEEQYGRLYPLHPNRPALGTTSNPEADGLFTIGADFTPGFGSQKGRGYILDVHMATLQDVAAKDQEKIVSEVVERVRTLLPEYFPQRKLEIVADGTEFKIVGDFSLGSV